MHSAFEVGDWEVCFQLQAEETSVNKDQAKKGLDCSLKIWEHMQTEIWSRQMQCWMVNTILDLSVTFWKLKWDLKHLEVFRFLSGNFYFKFIDKFWVKKNNGIVLSYHKPNFLNFLSKISVTSNHMSFQKTFLSETQAAGLQVSKWKILIRNKQSVKQILQRRRLILKNSVWSNFTLMELMG